MKGGDRVGEHLASKKQRRKSLRRKEKTPSEEKATTGVEERKNRSIVCSVNAQKGRMA